MQPARNKTQHETKYGFYTDWNQLIWSEHVNTALFQDLPLDDLDGLDEPHVLLVLPAELLTTPNIQYSKFDSLYQ